MSVRISTPLNPLTLAWSLLTLSITPSVSSPISSTFCYSFYQKNKKDQVISA
nr:MAG TPA: hypothetical protein [Caudoviricetes sp.]